MYIEGGYRLSRHHSKRRAALDGHKININLSWWWGGGGRGGGGRKRKGEGSIQHI